MARGRGSFLGDTRITRGALYLLVASTAASLLFLFLGRETQAELAPRLFASADTVVGDLAVWTVLTSPLLEPEFVALLFQALMLWLFMPTLERWWGMPRFLRFALYTSLAGVVGGVAVGLALGGGHAATPVSGLDPFVFAGILAFGVLYADHPVRFFGAIPMKGRQLAIGIVVFTFAFIIIGQRWVEGGANAAAMLLAYAMTSSSGRFSPKLWWLKWKQARIRRRLGVIDGGKKPGRPGKPGKNDQRWLN